MPLASAAAAASRWRISSSSIWRSRTSPSLAGLDGPHIGLVDPLDASARIAEPGRHRQGIEQGAPGERVAHQLPVLVEDREQGRACGRRHRAGAGWRGPPAARPSASTWPPAAVLSSELNGRPSANSASRPRLSSWRGGQVEPFAELQEIGVVLRAGRRRSSQRMHHHAHALALLPEHQHLRLGLDDGLGSQQVLAQLGHLGAVRTGLPAPTHSAVGERSRDGGTSHGYGQQEGDANLLGKVESAAATGNGNHQRRHDEHAQPQEQRHLAARPAACALGARVCPPHQSIDWADPQPAYAGPEARARRPLTLTNR